MMKEMSNIDPSLNHWEQLNSPYVLDRIRFDDAPVCFVGHTIFCNFNSDRLIKKGFFLPPDLSEENWFLLMSIFHNWVHFDNRRYLFVLSLPIWFDIFSFADFYHYLRSSIAAGHRHLVLESDRIGLFGEPEITLTKISLPKSRNGTKVGIKFVFEGLALFHQIYQERNFPKNLRLNYLESLERDKTRNKLYIDAFRFFTDLSNRIHPYVDADCLTEIMGIFSVAPLLLPRNKGILTGLSRWSCPSRQEIETIVKEGVQFLFKLYDCPSLTREIKDSWRSLSFELHGVFISLVEFFRRSLVSAPDSYLLRYAYSMAFILLCSHLGCIDPEKRPINVPTRTIMEFGYPPPVIFKDGRNLILPLSRKIGKDHYLALPTWLNYNSIKALKRWIIKKNQSLICPFYHFCTLKLERNVWKDLLAGICKPNFVPSKDLCSCYGNRINIRLISERKCLFWELISNIFSSFSRVEVES